MQRRQRMPDAEITGRTIFWTVQILAWSAFGINNYLQTAPDLLAVEKLPVFLIKMGFSVLGLCFSSLLYALYIRLIRHIRDTMRLLLSAALASCVVGLVWHLVYRLSLPPPFGGIGMILRFTFITEAVNNVFVLLAWSAAFFGLKFWRDSKLQEQAVVEANALAHEAQLRALKYQLNPHFLFNALNSVRALTRDDRERAGEMVTQLSEFLRAALTETPLTETTLEHEIDVLQKYLAVEQTRFEDKLEVVIELDSGAKTCLIPALLVHPLLENAIKHGMRTSAMPLQVVIRGTKLDGQLRIEVANTGRLIAPDTAGEPSGSDTGIGVSNVRGRLEHTYPGNYEFAVYQDGDWVRAVMTINQTPRETYAAGT